MLICAVQYLSQSFISRDGKLEDTPFKCKLKSEVREGKEVLSYLV